MFDLKPDSPAFWQRCFLDDAAVRRIVLTGEIVEALLDDSRSPIELSGYLTGVVEGDTFYAVSKHLLCYGKPPTVCGKDNREVGLEQYRGANWIFQEHYCASFQDRVPGATTVLFHFHPYTDAGALERAFGEYAPEVIDALMLDLRSGAYAHLGGGVTLDAVVNETFSRMLSEADIVNTPGNVHLLVTDTGRDDDPLAHLNGYRLHKEDLTASVIEVATAASLDDPCRTRFAALRALSDEAHAASVAWAWKTFPSLPPGRRLSASEAFAHLT